MEAKKYNRQGNMLIETENKTFNRKTIVITHGNVIAPTMFGFYIRSPKNTECNGFTFPEWHLFKTDMKPFREELRLNQRVIDYVAHEALKRDKSVILYAFFHWRGQKRIIHGFVLTDWDYKHIETFYSNYRSKTISVLNECKKYICN